MGKKIQIIIKYLMQAHYASTFISRTAQQDSKAFNRACKK